ncbi:MAG: glycosyltransferase family 4 protein [Anaerolineae bacterium]
MRIGINYTPALRQGAGIGRYTRGLVSALATLGAANRYTLVISRDSPLDRLPPLPANFSLKTLPLSERALTILWHRFNLPLAIDRLAGPFDLFHAPDFVLPPLRRAPGLLTVHDLSFLMHPDGALPNLRRWLRQVVPRSIARARHVLADSHSTKLDLQRLLNVPPDKISVVGAGVEPRFAPVTAPDVLARVRRTYRLPHHFILGLGTLEPRKNFTGLIDAFTRLPADFSDVHLVIAGGKGWLYGPIFEAAAQSPAADRIHFTGFVADEDLLALYSLARVFAYPSHYEGFGIPVLEAMACGTPVVTANNSSLPEIAGEAALLIEAADTPALADALGRLCADDSLRRRCIRRGFDRVPLYTWPGAAQKLLAVYRQVIGPAAAQN